MIEATLNTITLKAVGADITAINVDAIVHAARSDLNMTVTGLGRSILAKGGNSIQDEANAIGGCEPGEVVMTRGGTLTPRYVLHAVGPVMGTGNARAILGSAVWSAVQFAEKQGIRSLAFPAIGTGKHGGFPVEACARIMAQRIVDFTFEDVDHLKTLVVCLITPETLSVFEAAFRAEIDKAIAEV